MHLEIDYIVLVKSLIYDLIYDLRFIREIRRSRKHGEKKIIPELHSGELV